ncbi:MAG: DUF58 domain-containing protein [Planctomycetales bacterium]|nr:DUF58 domain-containing protein [Planctomycetales bacterium]
MASDSLPRHFDPRTLDRIKRLDVRARLVVEGFLTGQHQSPYHGFAVEFAAHREYVPGDDIRHIDWKVWSKTDRLYIKEYEEETNLRCLMVVDCSKSMDYGSVKQWSKFDHAATAAASLAFLLQQQQDSVGLLTFGNKIESQLRPAGGQNHIRQLMHVLEETKPSQVTDVGDVFREVAGQLRQRGLVAIFSDLFVDTPTLVESLQRLRHRGHEVIVFHVMHDDEIKFPFDDNTLFKGMEQDVQLYTEPRSLRKAYIEAVEAFMERTKSACAGLGIDHVLVNTSEPLDAVLARYLSFRLKVRKRARR